MKTITKNCKFCRSSFEALLREHKRGNSKFCSRSCMGNYFSQTRKLIRKPNVICSYCNAKFYKNPHQFKNSKSGLYFCSRKHKDLAQKISSGITAIHPDHYKTGSSIDYRTLAINHYGAVCVKCDYKKCPDILEVNHIDRDRKNNKIENLEVLCPTCHNEFHFLTKTGKWKSRK